MIVKKLPKNSCKTVSKDQKKKLPAKHITTPRYSILLPSFKDYQRSHKKKLFMLKILNLFSLQIHFLKILGGKCLQNPPLASRTLIKNNLQNNKNNLKKQDP